MESPEYVEREDGPEGVVTLKLSNGKVNALSVDLLERLTERCADLAADPPGCVVVTGNRRAFAAGADISGFGSVVDGVFRPASADEARAITRAFGSAGDALAALRCPTIAAVSGYALGGGCELALACDLRIAAESAVFGQPEILLGIIPGGGGTQRLPRLVGTARAKDLIFSGRQVDAAEALDWGLVDRVVPDDDLEAEAAAWALTFARGPRDALALAKAAIDRGLAGDLSEGIAIEQDLFVGAFATPDAEVGIDSFRRNGPGKAVFTTG